MAHVFLERWARPLLLVHAGLVIALMGASTHLVLVARKLLRAGGTLRLGQVRLLRVYGQTTPILYAASFACGLLIYPTYRYHVRGLYLDRHAPWASNLFDIKENLAALALPLAVALYVMTRRLDPRRELGTVPVIATLALTVWLTVLFSTVSGLLITCVRGV